MYRLGAFQLVRKRLDALPLQLHNHTDSDWCLCIGRFSVLFLVLWTRSRNKEIAILLAVGRSKVEIIAQFLVENILIGILSIFASTALSFGLANQIGSFIISKAGENISNLNIQIATSDMIKVFGIGFILICLAVIIASYTIIRLRPKDILTKME